MADKRYRYDEVPVFKRQASALNLSSMDGTFYGNIVVSCTGRSPCYSKFSKLMHSVTQNMAPTSSTNNNDEKSSKEWSDDDRMTIRGALWTKSEKLRKYFIALLENTENTTKYKELYDNLKNVQFKISDDKADYILNEFVKMVQNNDEFLLQCLANFTCKLGARPLWNELNENGVDNDDLTDVQAVLEKVEEVRKSPFYQEMKSKGVVLDDNEILAIYIYSANDEFADLMQKHLKIGCKWKQTFYYFVRGVLKIYDCKVYGEENLDKLPSDLYHPVFLSSINVNEEIKLLSTINCTASKDCARDFAPPDGSMFVFEDCAKALSTGQLIGAPIDWISPHPNENEWVVLPTILSAMDKPSKFVHNSVLINITKYKTINCTFFGVDVLTKLSNLSYIQNLTKPTKSESDIDDDGDDEKEHDLNYYKNKCNELQNELNKLRGQQFDVEEVSKEKEEEKKKGDDDVKIPFKKIENEAFLISEKGCNASMCVTSCNGELNPPFISSKGINYLKSNYSTNELDIFVNTYAKCGTTVGIKMVWKILEMNGKISAGSNENKLNNPWEAVPWIEVDVSQQLLDGPSPNDFLSLIEHSNKQKTPRIWKTHAPFINFPASKIGENTKIIHIIRNPKDVICSYYDFFKKEPLVNYKGNFHTLFNWFCDGSVVHSNFFDFELNWFRTKLTKKQLLIISYEDINQKPNETIKKVIDFLGYTDKMNDDKKINEIAEYIKFKNAKKDKDKISIIVNKGIIGRWKTILTDEQSNRIDRIINARLKDIGINFTFQ